MTTVTVEQAQANLREIIRQMTPGDELVIVENQQPVAKLVSEASPRPRLRPGPGLGKGIITIIADDDEHLADFSEYVS